MATAGVNVFEMDSSIRGYHVFRDCWTARDGQILTAEVELGNSKDIYAVSLKLAGDVVGHVPKKMSRIFHFFLLRGGTIESVVTGPKKHASDLIQGGLDIPCKYVCSCHNRIVLKKLKKLVQNISREQ